jgi:hypothetical protein
MDKGQLKNLGFVINGINAKKGLMATTMLLIQLWL